MGIVGLLIVGIAAGFLATRAVLGAMLLVWLYQTYLGRK